VLLVVACSRAGAEVKQPQPAGATNDPIASASSASGSASAPAAHAAPEARARTASRGEHPSTGAASGPQELAVSGFETAVIVVPPAERATPLLVATHGAGGDPAWECERWAHVARGRWFLACPRGTPIRRGEAGSYFYPDHPALEREVSAVVAAVRARYGARVSDTDGVYLGYSQGATMGALMVVDHGALFPHLVLIEGGSGDWTQKRAARFRETGGRSVFIVCGTEPCAKRATASAAVLERAGLHAVASYAEGAGHTELGAAGARAEALLETLAKPLK
jgi:predicted esterase